MSLATITTITRSTKKPVICTMQTPKTKLIELTAYHLNKPYISLILSIFVKPLDKLCTFSN